MMPINTLLLCLHFPRYFLQSGTNHRLASYFARLIGAMQVTDGSCSILLGMEVAPVLSSALVVLIQIYTLINCFPHALGVVGTEGHFKRMRAQNGPSSACFAPLAIYADARCLTPLRPLHMVQRRSPKGPPRSRVILFSPPPLPSTSLPAVLSSSPLISQQRDAIGRLSSRLKASNVDITSQSKASCRLCEYRCSDPPFFPSSLLGLSRRHSFLSSIYWELGWSSSRYNSSLLFLLPFSFFLSLTSTTSFPLAVPHATPPLTSPEKSTPISKRSTRPSVIPPSRRSFRSDFRPHFDKMDDENNPYLIITSDEDVFFEGKKANALHHWRLDVSLTESPCSPPGARSIPQSRRRHLRQVRDRRTTYVRRLVQGG